MSFENALAKTLGFEGGVSDHPLDRGGLTKWGVTQRAYDLYRNRHSQRVRPVTEMDDAEMRELYREDYWQPIQGDALPERLAEMVFDMAVNSGVSAAKRTLQRAVGAHVDGVIGPQTIAAAQLCSPIVFLKARAAHFRDVVRNDPGQVEFLHGWINRLLDQAWRT